MILKSPQADGFGAGVVDWEDIPGTYDSEKFSSERSDFQSPFVSSRLPVLGSWRLKQFGMTTTQVRAR